LISGALSFATSFFLSPPVNLHHQLQFDFASLVTFASFAALSFAICLSSAAFSFAACLSAAVFSFAAFLSAAD